MSDANEVDLNMDDDDPEVDALNEEAEAKGERGFWARHMNGDIMWHEAPDRERCGGHGYMNCYCGGDFCCCGNGGEIECMGCEDCEGDDDFDDGGWEPNA